jgi:hypothetical protein
MVISRVFTLSRLRSRLAPSESASRTPDRYADSLTLQCLGNGHTVSPASSWSSNATTYLVTGEPHLNVSPFIAGGLSGAFTNQEVRPSAFHALSASSFATLVRSLRVACDHCNRRNAAATTKTDSVGVVEACVPVGGHPTRRSSVRAGAACAATVATAHERAGAGVLVL